MSHAGPDNDDQRDPGGTPQNGPDNLIAKPVTPGIDDDGTAGAVPGAYDADEAEQERGKAVKPGN